MILFYLMYCLVLYQKWVVWMAVSMLVHLLVMIVWKSRLVACQLGLLGKTKNPFFFLRILPPLEARFSKMALSLPPPMGGTQVYTAYFGYYTVFLLQCDSLLIWFHIYILFPVLHSHPFSILPILLVPANHLNLLKEDSTHGIELLSDFHWLYLLPVQIGYFAWHLSFAKYINTYHIFSTQVTQKFNLCFWQALSDQLMRDIFPDFLNWQTTTFQTTFQTKHLISTPTPPREFLELYTNIGTVNTRIMNLWNFSYIIYVNICRKTWIFGTFSYTKNVSISSKMYQ